jgi:hypothetical protein
MDKANIETICGYCGCIIPLDNNNYLHVANMYFCNKGCYAGYVYLYTCGGV